MSNTYTLNFKNDSNMQGNICVYQTDPNITDPNIMSLVWFSKACSPTTKVKFTWTLDYCFVWSETGTLKPGIQFDASQVWDADLNNNNSVSLKKDNGAYTFFNQGKSGSSGTLYINEDSSIPSSKEASVGIGMSGNGTFVVQARPNMNVNFTPTPQYWVVFGNHIEGEVLSINDLTNKAQIKFPSGVYSMSAILNEDFSWTVGATSEFNKKIVENLK